MTQPVVRPVARWKLALTVVCLSTLLAVVSSELGLRLFAPIPYSMEVQYEVDGHLGARLAPDQTYALADGGTCSVNHLRMRGPQDVSYLKPEGTFRVVALGGSSTFSFETDDEGIWTRVLERQLRQQWPERSIEVLNAGVPGYTTFESKINYLYRIRAMRPDVVVVYHTWNDIKRYLRLDRDRAIWRGVHKPNPVKSFLWNFQLAWRTETFLNTYVNPRLREDHYPVEGDATTHHVQDGGPAHRWARQNFEDIATWVRDDGALAVLVSQATLVSAETIRVPELRAMIVIDAMDMPFAELARQFDATTGFIRDAAQSRGAIFLDARSQLPPTPEVFRDHVHLTAEGNRLLGEYLARSLIGDPRFRERVQSRTTGGAPPDGP